MPPPESPVPPRYADSRIMPRLSCATARLPKDL
jgi:hypothetical protein